jgi:signal transduction histidine kinase
MESLQAFLMGEGFMPHGHCYLWIPSLLWLNVVSDTLIACSYLTIPVTLVFLVRKRRDIPFNWMFGAFGLFILACGATHVMEIWTIWNPAYWLSAYLKALTASASVVTAILLVKLIPAALSIPSQHQLAQANEELRRANEELQRTNEALAQTQKQLVQKEKMAALGGLVAGIAHEINTPVGIVITSASVLTHHTREVRDCYAREDLSEEGLAEYLDGAQQAAQLIETNGVRAAELIQSFKQVAVDQTAGEQRRINMRDYISETLTSLTPVLKTHEANIVAPEKLEVTTYPGAWAQIITNLVLNSVTHGFDGISAGRIRIAVEALRDRVVLRYTDNGKGIPVPLRAKVFEPFFTTRRNAGGSGLGLHILFNLVTQTLAGCVRIEDAPDEQGVQFTIEVPLTAGASSAA